MFYLFVRGHRGITVIILPNIRIWELHNRFIGSIISVTNSCWDTLVISLQRHVDASCCCSKLTRGKRTNKQRCWRITSAGRVSSASHSEVSTNWGSRAVHLMPSKQSFSRYRSSLTCSAFENTQTCCQNITQCANHKTWTAWTKMLPQDVDQLHKATRICRWGGTLVSLPIRACAVAPSVFLNKHLRAVVNS